MVSLNPFVEQNKARINVFLNSLCEVGDFYDTLEVSASPYAILRVHVAYRTPRAYPDGPVYGFVEEGSSNQYHHERAVQHAFSACAACGGPSESSRSEVFSFHR